MTEEETKKIIIPRPKPELPELLRREDQMISVIPATRVMINNIFVESNVEGLNMVVKTALKLWKETREKGFASYIA